jgi:uncharacterized protein (TIGR02246 family)
MTTAEHVEAERLVGVLQGAWNAMDGDAFAAPFAEDADFVNVLGEHFRGRKAVGVGHVGIFRTIYAGSTVMMKLERVRLLRPDVALAHVHSNLDVPQGPLAGRHVARFSMVLTRGADGWEIAAFHNTRMEGTRTPPR